MDTSVQKSLIANTQMARFVFALSFEGWFLATKRPSGYARDRVRGSFLLLQVCFFLKFYENLPLAHWKITRDGKVIYNGYKCRCTVHLVILSSFSKHVQTLT